LGGGIDRANLSTRHTEIETIYRFRATTRDKKEAHVRALLLQSISGHGYQLVRWRAPTSTGPTSSKSEPSSRPLVATMSRSKAAAGRLGLEPNVTSVRWHVVERDGRGALGPDDTSDG